MTFLLSVASGQPIPLTHAQAWQLRMTLIGMVPPCQMMPPEGHGAAIIRIEDNPEKKE